MAIAILTDFGTRDHFVAAMKGVILGISPDTRLVDITHDIERHNIAEAAYTIAACDRDFPAGTVFLCVVDPGVGSSRRAIAVECGGRVYVSPDNGLLTSVLSRGEQWQAFELAEPRFMAPEVSGTFHGRDVFAPAAAYLSRGSRIEEFGPKVVDPIRFASDPSDTVVVVHVDHFGNLVTSLPASGELAQLRSTVNGNTIKGTFSSYSEAPSGVPFFINGSAGLVEIVVREGSAAELLAARTGTVIDFDG